MYKRQLIGTSAFTAMLHSEITRVVGDVTSELDKKNTSSIAFELEEKSWWARAKGHSVDTGARIGSVESKLKTLIETGKKSAEGKKKGGARSVSRRNPESKYDIPLPRRTPLPSPRVAGMDKVKKRRVAIEKDRRKKKVEAKEKKKNSVDVEVTTPFGSIIGHGPKLSITLTKGCPDMQLMWGGTATAITQGQLLTVLEGWETQLHMLNQNAPIPEDSDIYEEMLQLLAFITDNGAAQGVTEKINNTCYVVSQTGLTKEAIDKNCFKKGNTCLLYTSPSPRD